MASFEKVLFWEKPIAQISRKIARALPFMSNTSVTQNIAEKLNTTEEGAHMVLIGLTTFVTPGFFKIAWTPFALVELIKAYRKGGLKDVREASKWYLRSAAAGVTVKEGTASIVKAVKNVVKGS